MIEFSPFLRAGTQLAAGFLFRKSDSMKLMATLIIYKEINDFIFVYRDYQSSSPHPAFQTYRLRKGVIKTVFLEIGNLDLVLIQVVLLQELWTRWLSLSWLIQLHGYLLRFLQCIDLYKLY